MTNYHSTLVNSLKTILPTYYELTLTSDIQTPCISYMEISNNIISGDTLTSVGEVAEVTYQVKVWGNDIGTLNQKAEAINTALKPTGWKRISTQEMYDRESAMIQKIMLFSLVNLD